MPQEDLLPLEIWLSKQDSRHFPEEVNYFSRYLIIKEWLTVNVYPFIGVAAGSIDGHFYNDHGPKHFQAVIKYAGKLLGLDNDGVWPGTDSVKPFILYPYEVFLLLCSILVHDAGMVTGRIGHEKKILPLLKKMGPLGIGDSFERQQIADIASAHGGRTFDGDKDTIGQPNLLVENELLDCKFRPKMIAAIVRFADEICEDKTRASRFLLQMDGDSGFDVKAENKVFHKYTESVNSVSVDLLSRTVTIKYIVYVEDVVARFGRLHEEVFLVDEIYSRLEKMNNERIYCNRFMSEIAQVNKIRASICLVQESDESVDTLDEIGLDLEDVGYPDCKLYLSDIEPGWKGEDLCEKYSVSNSVQEVAVHKKISKIDAVISWFSKNLGNENE